MKISGELEYHEWIECIKKGVLLGEMKPVKKLYHDR